MRKSIMSIMAAALIVYIATPPTDAAATTIGQADALCKKNKNCVTMERGDKGNIYCVRQQGGACKVVVCPKTGNCFVYMTVPGGSPDKPKNVKSTAGIQQVLEGSPGAPLVPPTGGILDTGPAFSPQGPARTGSPRGGTIY
jgi:hypothetical protein